MKKGENNLKEKALVVFSIVLSFVIVVYIVFLLAVKIKNNFSHEPKVDLASLEVLSYKMQLLPKDSELKANFNADLNADLIDENALKAYQNSLNLYLIKAEKSNIKIKDKSEMTDLEYAQANLKAYDEIGYIVIPEKNRKRTREILVENINKLKNNQEIIPNK